MRFTSPNYYWEISLQKEDKKYPTLKSNQSIDAIGDDTLDIRELLSREIVLTIDPAQSTLDANSILAEWGGYIKELAVVAKAEDGRVSYPSAAAPSSTDFLADFSALASDLDIKTYAIVHSFGDSFMGEDFAYSTGRSGEMVERDFVCPRNTSFWKYMGTICREIARFPVTGIILAEHYYPRQEYCFCKRCRRELDELTGVGFDVTYTQLSKAANILPRFHSWRQETITESLREIMNSVKSEREDMEIYVMVPLDPATDWGEGVRTHMGMDPEAIVGLGAGIVFHTMPFTPMYPEPGDENFLKLVQGTRVARRAQEHKKDLFIWGLEREENVSWLERLKQEAKAQRIMARLDYPESFNRKIEIHRGLS